MIYSRGFASIVIIMNSFQESIETRSFLCIRTSANSHYPIASWENYKRKYKLQTTRIHRVMCTTNWMMCNLAPNIANICLIHICCSLVYSWNSIASNGLCTFEKEHDVYDWNRPPTKLSFIEHELFDCFAQKKCVGCLVGLHFSVNILWNASGFMENCCTNKFMLNDVVYCVYIFWWICRKMVNHSIAFAC